MNKKISSIIWYHPKEDRLAVHENSFPMLETVLLDYDGWVRMYRTESQMLKAGWFYVGEL